jgi:lipid II:glycine glycyltransferase (peptidoglycan interpeptide bridge formation enzyme)
VWCREQGVVAEFVRYHPFLGNEAWDSQAVEAHIDRTTVSSEIAAPDEMMAAFSGNTRNMIRKSGRLGVRIEAVDTVETMSLFASMYKMNMDYVNADPYYYFAPAYFEGLAALIRERGFMLVARHESDVLAGVLFLQGRRFLHYHLSAADYSKRKTGTTNAILFDALCRGHKANLERLHLGGGTTSAKDDSLFKFKESMGTHYHAFYIGKRVHQLEPYTRLKAAWRAAFPEQAKYSTRVLCYRYRDSA